MKLVRPETMTLPDEERFLAASRCVAVARCKTRILELDGEILGEIPTDEDETPTCDSRGRPRSVSSPSGGAGASHSSFGRNGLSRSIGTGNSVVEFFSAAISRSVCR